MSLDKNVLEIFTQRMKHHQGFIVLMNKKIAGYVWVATSKATHQGDPCFQLDISPSQNTNYWYDGFIFPEYRNSGAMTCLLNYLTFVSKQQKFKKAFWLAESKNVSILKVAHRVGFKIEGTVRYTRFMNHIHRETSALEKL